MISNSVHFDLVQVYLTITDYSFNSLRLWNVCNLQYSKEGPRLHYQKLSILNNVPRCIADISANDFLCTLLPLSCTSINHISINSQSRSSSISTLHDCDCLAVKTAQIIRKLWSLKVINIFLTFSKICNSFVTSNWFFMSQSIDKQTYANKLDWKAWIFIMLLYLQQGLPAIWKHDLFIILSYSGVWKCFK